MAGIKHFFWLLTFYTYCLLNYLQYLWLAVSKGSFFRQPTEKDRNELLLARDHYWNLSKSVANLHHRFFVTRDGRQLHYLTNIEKGRPSPVQGSTLIILIHGFPDCSSMWRYITESRNLHSNATIVAVDLPGTGGSDSFPNYGATVVLEALTEFIVGMRERYLGEKDRPIIETERRRDRVFIVGHDWGCLLSYRLATEAAPGLSHRYVLTNGPNAPLAMANKDRILQSSRKMLLTFARSPRYNFHCLSKALHAFGPLLKQFILFGYIFAFQLPQTMIKFLATVANSSFPKLIHKSQYGVDRASFNPHHSMATSIGPGEAECQTETSEDSPQTYGSSVLARARDAGSWYVHFTAYYRDGAAFDKWEKSLNTLAAFHDIDAGNEDLSRTSSHGPEHRPSSAPPDLLAESRSSSLKAPATVLWGKKDLACSEEICLRGIGDYLSPSSQVVMLPDTGHWTPLEKQSRDLLKRILEAMVQKSDVDKGDLQAAIEETYPGASVSIVK